MTARSWARKLFARTSPAVRDRRAKSRPRFETLEGREAPAVLTVNSVADTASPSDPYLSLRQAIAIVNSATLPGGLSPQIQAQISGTLHAGGKDTIQFDHAKVTAPITLTGSRLVLSLPAGTAAVTIEGGAPGVTVNRFNGAASQFELTGGVQATFSRLTITGGFLGGGFGAGIYNAGTLTLGYCNVSANSADMGSGAGVYNVGTLTVTDSNFSNNSANFSFGGGAGIYNVGTLAVSGSTFSGNHADNSPRPLPNVGGGGAIYNSGTAWVSASAFTDNHADRTAQNGSSIAGGAIHNGFNGSGNMTVIGCTFTDNHADGIFGGSGGVGGGAVFNNATLKVINSTLSANTASGTFSGGGGILNWGTLTVSGSTLSANHAANSVGVGAGGGAINNGGTLSVTNSSLDGNSGDGTRNGGGAIYNTGALTVTSSTLTANSAAGSGFNFDGGGGINGADGGSITLVNTVVALNTTNDTGPDVSGPVVATSHHNLIGNGSGMSGIGQGANGNLVGTGASPTNPLLDTLGSRGGPTQTRSAKAGSPVLNAGDPAQLGTADQRGVTRLGGVNIGAFQASAAAVQLTAPVSVTAGSPFAVNVTAVDHFGQLAVGYRGTLQFSSSDPQATLPANYTFTAADNGVHLFGGVTLRSPGPHTLTAANGVIGAVTEFTIPTAGSQPTGITAGPDGNFWFVESQGNKVGRITPAGTITEFTVPTPGGSPYAITAGPDGNLWFVEQWGNKVGRITPAGVVTEFPIPTANSRPVGITPGPDGNLWFVEYDGNKVGRITPAGVITEFAIPTPGSNPYGITAGPDGNLWFVEYNGNRVGRITLTGVITEFPIPTAGSSPYGITAGPDGNLWFTEAAANKVGRITPAGVVTEFAIPTPNSSPLAITAGADGNLWFVEGNLSGNQVGRITPSGIIKEFSIPTGGSLPYGIAASPDGNLWFVELNGNKVGRLASATPNGTINISVQPAPASFLVTTDADSGAGSLRQALSNANGSPGTDTITFEPAFFATPRTILLTSGELSVTDSVTVAGPAGGVTVSGNNASRVFNINIGNLVVGDVAMSDLTITGGNAGGGAGIAASNDNLTLTRCTVSNNTSGGQGGGVSTGVNAGTWTFTNCTLSGNTGARGGALYFFNYGTLNMTGCTVSGNKATDAGGGGALYNYFANATIINSTFSGNDAANGSGGAIRIVSSGSVTLRNSTLTGNTAAGVGGGIRRGYGGALTLISTIVAGNTAATADSHDLDSAGALDVGGDNNLVGVMDPANNVTLTGSGNLTGTAGAPLDAKLGPLANNGGPTRTHAITPASPAYNAGNAAGLTVDQRGFARLAAGAADVGAYEFAPLVVTTDANSGPGSLRQAILDANAAAGADSISFDPAFFATPRTIVLTGGELTVTDSATISGPAGGVFVSGNNASRVFHLAVAGTGNVTMSDLTITAGKAAGGAGILANDDNLTLTRCSVSNNTSTGATTQGGGVSTGGAAGTWTFADSTFSGNIGARGGAIYFFTTGTLNMTGCTVSGNKSTDANGGGGLYNYTNTATIINSTFSGNEAAGGAGGAIQIFSNATVTVRNSTVTGNTAATAGGGINQRLGTLSLSSTIAAGNAAGTAGTQDLGSLSAVAVAGDNNLIGVMDPANNVTLTGAGSLTGTKASPLDAKLGPLANNGGPTLTHSLLAGSPAVNQGNNAVTLTTDQRGSGFNRVIGSQADIGAYELQVVTPPSKVTTVTVNGGAAQRSRVTAVQVAFDQLVSFSGTPESAFQLKRQADGAVVPLGASVDNTGPGSVVTLTFAAGAAVDFGSLADGRYTLTVDAGQVSNASGPLDGNGDGAGGDNFVLIGAPGTASNLFRLFGDNDGDGDVDALDFGQFRAAFGGTSNLAFDFDADGDVDAVDFGQFRQRFGTSV